MFLVVGNPAKTGRAKAEQLLANGKKVCAMSAQDLVRRSTLTTAFP
jgi:hypothetical protein